MRFEQTLSDNLRRAYKVVVTSEEISSAFKEIIEKKIKSKQYPGFRFGKAPFDYVAKKEAGIQKTLIDLSHYLFQIIFVVIFYALQL